MSANITDYFNKASNMSGDYPPIATVTAARSTGGEILTCDDLAGWTTDTPVHFSTFQVGVDGAIDSSTQTDWKGIVVGNTITEMTRLAGAADSGNASGDRVELNPTIGWLDDLITGLLISHKQDGTLKDNSVSAGAIASGAVTTGKIANDAVTADKIADGAIDANEKVGNDVIQARNLAPEVGDYSTSEQDTGFTWIDGKHIYKKTVNTGALPDNTSKATAHSISNISYILRIEGWAERPSDHTTTSLPFISTTGSGSVTIYADRTNITLWTNSDRTAYSTSYTTLYYTKSS